MDDFDINVFFRPLKKYFKELFEKNIKIRRIATFPRDLIYHRKYFDNLFPTLKVYNIMVTTSECEGCDRFDKEISGIDSYLEGEQGDEKFKVLVEAIGDILKEKDDKKYKIFKTKYEKLLSKIENYDHDDLEKKLKEFQLLLDNIGKNENDLYDLLCFPFKIMKSTSDSKSLNDLETSVYPFDDMCYDFEFRDDLKLFKKKRMFEVFQICLEESYKIYLNLNLNKNEEISNKFKIAIHYCKKHGEKLLSIFEKNKNYEKEEKVEHVEIDDKIIKKMKLEKEQTMKEKQNLKEQTEKEIKIFEDKIKKIKMDYDENMKKIYEKIDKIETFQTLIKINTNLEETEEDVIKKSEESVRRKRKRI